MTSTAAHAMPFGAEHHPDGTVRFRLWAPGQSRIDLVLGSEERVLAMPALADGWFERTCQAEAGTRYCFALANGQRVPDPASRAQVRDVHGPSLVFDPASYRWQTPEWRGRPWEEVVLYELHIGTFSEAGDFDGVRGRLNHLSNLGVTAVELMPVSAFHGRHNWGYDGVLPFAPATAYGSADAFKRLIDEAHAHGLMVFLDVVYNHFGVEGNYLNLYAPAFFTSQRHTPWGAAIDFSVPQVRDFFVHNALYWLEEYRIDGLRLDAVHAIFDESEPHILGELATRVRAGLPRERHVHLVLENDANEARYLTRDGEGRPRHYTAQWNDDFHHAAHCLLTGEADGYYADYATAPLACLARALCEGFVYQGEASGYRGGTRRGEPSRHLPLTAFVDFLQNHDQIGNRALGERLDNLCPPGAVAALLAIMLLAPSVPLLFMGEEWAARTPFLYFTNYEGELASAVREGRRAEFRHFPEFADHSRRALIPDPNAPATVWRSHLDWSESETRQGIERLALLRQLLTLRRREIVPRLSGQSGNSTSVTRWGKGGLSVRWLLGDRSRLILTANLDTEPATPAPRLAGRLLYQSDEGLGAQLATGLPAWSVLWHLAEPA